VLSFIPGLPNITLDPEFVFLVILPPLLYSAAWLTSWRDFSNNLVGISLMTFGLVTFTVVSVGLAAQWILPGVDWRVGLVLGAIVAPTDAIAASSIAKRLGLPRRVVVVLEGESLLNDASALLALEFGLGLLVAGHIPTLGEGAFRLCYLIGFGIAAGLIVGVIVHFVESRLDDAPIEIALSILIPYVAYLAAAYLNASGVLAVVACGLYLSRKSSYFFSPVVRLQAWGVWESLVFVFNGFVFVLIGLQLPYVIRGIQDYSLARVASYGVALSGLLILLRLLWSFPGAGLASILRKAERMPPARQTFIVGWTGMRGVVSMAAAISLPHALANGTTFTQRNLIIFLVFTVILVTLVGQGLTLPPLIRALGLSDTSGMRPGEREARRDTLHAALSHLDTLRVEAGPDGAEVFDDLEQHYRHRLATISVQADGPHGNVDATLYERFNELSRALLHVQRRAAIQFRDEHRISDDVLRAIERELDLSEARLAERAV
jgi:Na+/H+ antiporter